MLPADDQAMDEMFDAILAWQVARYLEDLTPEEREVVIRGRRGGDDDDTLDEGKRGRSWWRKLRLDPFPSVQPRV